VVQSISVSDQLYDRLRRTAAAMQKPLQEVAERALKGGLPPSADDAPEAHREALRQLESFSDEALWAVWRSAVEPAAATRHQMLLEQRAAGTLTPAEREELIRLRKTADRLLLRRAHAAALLRWRGHVLEMPG
jgi:hypothetical protein